MATIRKEVLLDAPAEQIWAAFRDVGAVHTKLARGFVTDTRMDGNEARIVTFANGFVAREQIVTVDAAAHRLAYAVVGSERLKHHNASFQVFAEGAGCRVVWIADLLPDAAAETIGAMMEQGCEAMRRTLQQPELTQAQKAPQPD
jgi:uncharacterized protein YndB with AHSA1/START domain